MVEVELLTKNENRVLKKKLENKRLSQIESNYLSRAIRPKLKKLEKIKEINVENLLQKIEYNQKGKSIELKISKLIRKSIDEKEIDAIIVYGSAIQTNYHSYNDVDVIILIKKKFWANEREKYVKIKEIKEKSEKERVVLDVQIIEKRVFYLEYPSSPDLIYQMKDSRVIYGKIKIPDKIKLAKIDLQMKLDWSDVGDISPRGTEIYKAIRNALLVRLLLNKIIDNQKLKQEVADEIGRNLTEKLKNNSESSAERKIALNYLIELAKKTREEIGGVTWEKIEL